MQLIDEYPETVERFFAQMDRFNSALKEFEDELASDEKTLI